MTENKLHTTIRMPGGSDRHRNGFALMEIILMLVIIGIIGTNTIMLMRKSWKSTGTSNHMLIAGQMIERQIESLRMKVAENPGSNFPPADSQFTENGISLSWKLSSVNRIGGGPTITRNHIRQCRLTAAWGRQHGDTLMVTTYIGKDF
jgi:hypothetical protein